MVDPENLSPWIPIVRDIAIVLLAAFMLVFATVWIKDPTPLAVIIGGGLSLLGVPAALRLDALRKKQNGQEKDDADRWSHLP
jgi:hypothetical protein